MRDGFDFNTRAGIILLIAAYMFYYVDVFLGLFLALALFSHTVPGFILSNYTKAVTVESYIALDFALLGSLLYAVLVKTDIDIDMMLNLICACVVLTFVCLALQKAQIDPYKALGMTSNMAPTGLMANCNETSAFLAIGSAAFFRKYWCFLIPIVVIPALVISGSLNGYLGFMAALTLYFSFKYKRILPIGIIVGVILVVIDTMRSDLSLNFRWYIWQKSVDLVFQNQPFLGFGLGNWKIIDSAIMAEKAYVTATHWSNVHNSFIQGYIEMGAGFLILLAGYLTNLCVRITKNQILSISACGAIFLCMNTNSLFQMNIINGVFVILWLAILKKQQIKDIGNYGTTRS